MWHILDSTVGFLTAFPTATYMQVLTKYCFNRYYADKVKLHSLVTVWHVRLYIIYTYGVAWKTRKRGCNCPTCSLLWLPPETTVCKVTLILWAVNSTQCTESSVRNNKPHTFIQERRSPCIPFMLGCSLYEPAYTGLHTAHGVCSIQEVSDFSPFQSLVPSRPLRVCQRWDRAHTTILDDMTFSLGTVKCLLSRNSESQISQLPVTSWLSD